MTEQFLNKCRKQRHGDKCLIKNVGSYHKEAKEVSKLKKKLYLIVNNEKGIFHLDRY